MTTQTDEAAIVDSPPFPRSYAAKLLALDRGRGSYVWDAAGRRYLDFGSGISVNALGYGRKDLARIAHRQMKRLIHVSNLYTTRPAVALAERLVRLGDFTAVHFGNSGTEANEAAIKFARLYGGRSGKKTRSKLLCFDGAFHGRTMGALSVTPSEKYQKPFEPLVPNVEVAALNDEAGLKRLDSGDFCAVIIEPVQGEGGLRKVEEQFARALNESCVNNDTLLIADEIQTGLGRCGYDLASRAVGIEPDIVTLSKPLGGGLPLSATLIPKRVNDLLSIGDHGTTFGGGPVTTAVALRVVQTVLAPDFLESVTQRSEVLERLLGEAAAKSDAITGVRGMGLLRGLVVDDTKAERLPDLLSAAQRRGLLLLRSGTNVIRIAPPLIIREDELAEGVAILSEAIAEVLG